MPNNQDLRLQQTHMLSNPDFVLGKVSSALTRSCDALGWGMELLVRSGNLGVRAFEFVAGGNLGLRAFEFVAGAVLGYLA